MWQILRRNPRAFGAALLLHMILAVFTLVGVDWLANFDDVRIEPQIAQATIVSTEAIEAQVAARRQAEAKRKAEEKIRQRAEAKRKAKEAAQRQAEAKRKAEEKIRQRAEAKRKAKEAAQRQAEAERKVAEAAQRRAEEEARQAREADLLAALDAEREAVGELGVYTNTIREHIRRNWVRQPGMGRGLSCLVEVKLIPGGEVVAAGVRVARSSGNPAFDRSVVTAVYKASPLPIPSGRLFGQFRNLRLDFKP